MIEAEAKRVEGSHDFILIFLDIFSLRTRREHHTKTSHDSVAMYRREDQLSQS